MQRTRNILIAGMVLAFAVGLVSSQEVIDRIVAKVDTDVILLSDVQALERYQLFIDGKSETDEEILERLIDQWIVRSEAAAALFPQPSEKDVARSLDRLRRSFATPEEYEERRKQSGLTNEEIERMLKAQLYLSNYLDSRFRASIQISDQDIEQFYTTRIVPRAESRHQTPPTLEAARAFIQEALVQRAINEQSERWLKESRQRVRVDNLLNEKPK